MVVILGCDPVSSQHRFAISLSSFLRMSAGGISKCLVYSWETGLGVSVRNYFLITLIGNSAS